MAPSIEFIPGLTLNRRLYSEVVRPLLDEHFPALPHSASLMGYGSDVLGYDTPISTDHNWGPRVLIFLTPADHARLAPAVDAILRTHLPPTFAGYSVHYSQPDEADNGTQHLTAHTGGPVNHMLSIGTVEGFFNKYLAIDLTDLLNDDLDLVDWLLLPEQKLLEATAGEVFFDGLGTLTPARARFTYYPDDVWKLKIAAEWSHLAQEEAFVGRTGDLGDDVGSWLTAARLTRHLMRLSFLYARQYAPYSKWLGTAIARLPIAVDLLPHMQALTTAADWHARETHLVALYQRMAAAHNASGLTAPLSTETRDYFGRPCQVLFSGRFADAITATIHDERMRRIGEIGAVDQFTDSVPIHSNAHLAAKSKSFYDTFSS